MALAMLWLAGCAPETAAHPEAARRGAATPTTASTQAPIDSREVAEPTPRPAQVVEAGLTCLQQAYPEHVCEVSPNTLIFCDGTRMAYDDGREKTATERLERPDLEDQMAQRVGAGAADGKPPPRDHDPGRARHLPFFEKLYGSDEEAVRRQLVEVPWPGGRSLRVTRVGGVDARLRAVAARLSKLEPPLVAIASQTAGAFNPRNVRGADRKSAHAFGIAVDVATELSDYHRWSRDSSGQPRHRNRVPLAIVDAFEREGFLWGGRWYHLDTMHFEYRPELMLEACRAPSARAGDEGAPEPPSNAVSRNAARYRWSFATEADTLAARFPPPTGYRRVLLAPGSFGHWLRGLPLKPPGTQVALHNGRPKRSQRVHAAVIDIDVGRRDLQQCADAVMRLRAEYLFGHGRGDEVCFRAANGGALPYRHWRRGERPPRGQSGPWKPSAAPGRTHGGFRRYLDHVFGIANTASLYRELEPLADASKLAPGDVYIEPARGGLFGHAVLVLDLAENASGEHLMLLAQSYMPAQDIHVLRNPDPDGPDPVWYRPATDGSLASPEWSFDAGSLRRFGSSCSE
ncbi:MAG: M15 family metallopeptidase [Myxococcales bacterium]|nr:M15 family metallopeptidase [Myxococcales bacterium]